MTEEQATEMIRILNELYRGLSRAILTLAVQLLGILLVLSVGAWVIAYSSFSN